MAQKCKIHTEILCNETATHVILYDVHIYVIYFVVRHMLGPSPDSGPKNQICQVFSSYDCYTVFIFCENCVFQPVHMDTLCNTRMCAPKRKFHNLKFIAFCLRHIKGQPIPVSTAHTLALILIHPHEKLYAFSVSL